ncbi:SMARCD3 isoform 5 [Pongo abelii]|uniref:SMARCD3 isoform 5 n=1 Tax=Pongo abelii TaxID=9601 RepID=A0A2J8RKK3_PONAB|nr:SMARCD3 isoform 5 [Pongo abelii]
MTLQVQDPAIYDSRSSAPTHRGTVPRGGRWLTKSSLKGFGSWSPSPRLTWTSWRLRGNWIKPSCGSGWTSRRL